MARKYWKRPDCTCKVLAKGLCMQKWKRGTIICLGINILLLYGLLTDYYEFFIKKCRDASKTSRNTSGFLPLKPIVNIFVISI